MDGYIRILKYIYDFQTLITGFAAVSAALIATLHSHRQMRLSSRELLISRGRALIHRRQSTTKLQIDIIAMRRHLEPWPDKHVEPNSFWAHSAEMQITTTIHALEKHQENSMDGQNIEFNRDKLIGSCKLLSYCLYDIHAVDSIDLGGFDEPPLDEKQSCAARALVASGMILLRIDNVIECAERLDESFATKVASVRKELHKIERLALKKRERNTGCSARR